MSLDTHAAIDLENAPADFDAALKKGDFTQCEAIIEKMGNLGHENLALEMHHQLNDAKAAPAPFFDDGSHENDISESMLRAGDEEDIY